jgi:hypothetical protein
MLRLFKLSNTCISTQGKFNFSTKSINQVRKFRGQIKSTYGLQDFTKNYDASNWVNKKIEEQKGKIPLEKFSSILTRQRRERLSPYLKADKRQLNRYLRGRTMQVIAKSEETDMKLLSESLFTKDHTAQSLENFRKMRENRIFTRKMHELAERKFAMKLESRKTTNLIENYEMKFLNYERHNASEGVGYKIYGSIDFFQESRYKYAHDIDTKNRLYKEPSGVISNQYIEYKENKKRLENLRIQSVLSGGKNNEELGKYLELINSTEKGELIKTLTEDRTEVLLAKDKGNEVDSIKPISKVDKYFKEHCELTAKINQFENTVYEEFKKLDLYNKYNKGIVQFKDLTVGENLNYIKFNISCGRDLFKMFKEVKELSPVISCALVQKISIGYKEEKDIFDLFIKPEYKQILTIVKNGIADIDNKNLVDTLWAIGKIHKGNRSFSNKFFQHLLNELLMELNKRLSDDGTSLNFLQISFLLDGLSMLRIKDSYDDLKVVEEEYNLTTLCKDRILKNSTFVDMALHPFHVVKVLNYYYNKNDKDMDKLLVHLGRPLLNFIKNENVKETTSAVDMVRTVSIYSFGIAKNVTQMRKPVIGDEESTHVEIVTGIESYKSSNALIKICQEVLETLKPSVIAHKQYEIKQAASLIYSYSIAEFKDEAIYRSLQKQVDDQLTALQEFRPEDLMLYTFGMARRYVKEHVPRFNLDPNSVIYPNLSEKNTSSRFITLKKFQRLMYEREKMFNAKYLSLVLYSSAMMGYSDIDFYLPIYNNIIVSQNQYSLRPEDIGYLLQTLALLNYNDQNVVMFLISKLFSNIEETLKNPRNAFSISQALTALVRLNARKQIRSYLQWQEVIDELVGYAMVNLSGSVNYLISFMWFFIYMHRGDKALSEFFYEVVNKEHCGLGKYDKILLNQITLTQSNQKKLRSALEEDVSAIEFDRLRRDVHTKLSQDRYETETPLKRVSRLLKANKSMLGKHGLTYEEDVVLFGSYIIPFQFGKKCLFIFDHTDILKTKTPTGYNVLLFELVLEIGLEPRYINTGDILDKSDKEVFDLIFNKIN